MVRQDTACCQGSCTPGAPMSASHAAAEASPRRSRSAGSSGGRTSGEPLPMTMTSVRALCGCTSKASSAISDWSLLSLNAAGACAAALGSVSCEDALLMMTFRAQHNCHHQTAQS